MSSLPPLLDSMASAMKAMSQHQRVIAENIANGETAGYKARTVAPEDFSSLLAAYGDGAGTPRVARPRVSLSSSMVALGAQAPEGSGGVILDSNTSETKPDGNNVTLEDQLLTLGEVQTDYSAVTNLYRKQMGLLRLALGNG